MKDDINKLKVTMSIKDLQSIKEFNRKEAQKELLEELIQYIKNDCGKVYLETTIKTKLEVLSDDTNNTSKENE